MSKISEIFDNEDTTPTQKLQSIDTLVQEARAAYGNTHMEITAPTVTTTAGCLEIQYLSDADKVQIAKMAFHSITSEAIETAQETEGVILDKEIQSLIATDPILVNLGKQCESEYL